MQAIKINRHLFAVGNGAQKNYCTRRDRLNVPPHINIITQEIKICKHITKILKAVS